jgi:hypothetical protein
MQHKEDKYLIEHIGHDPRGPWTGIEAYLYNVDDRFYRTDVYYSTVQKFKRDIQIFGFNEYDNALEYFYKKIAEFKDKFR